MPHNNPEVCLSVTWLYDIDKNKFPSGNGPDQYWHFYFWQPTPTAYIYLRPKKHNTHA